METVETAVQPGYSSIFIQVSQLWLVAWQFRLPGSINQTVRVWKGVERGDVMGRGLRRRVCGEGGPAALITMLSKPMYVFPMVRVYMQVGSDALVLPTAVQSTHETDHDNVKQCTLTTKKQYGHHILRNIY